MNAASVRNITMKERCQALKGDHRTVTVHYYELFSRTYKRMFHRYSNKLGILI
jgi:hypothetical protein